MDDKFADVGCGLCMQIESEGKPVTDQKSSGRCWIFALLNCMRLPVMKQLKLEDLEFSQNYLFFWDKVQQQLIYCSLFCVHTW